MESSFSLNSLIPPYLSWGHDTVGEGLKPPLLYEMQQVDTLSFLSRKRKSRFPFLQILTVTPKFLHKFKKYFSRKCENLSYLLINNRSSFQSGDTSQVERNTLSRSLLATMGTKPSRTKREVALSPLLCPGLKYDIKLQKPKNL